MIPEDLTKAEFLKKLRLVINKHANVKVEKATCHVEPHKRLRRSLDRREMHKHVALLMSGNFAHRKIAEAFFKETGLRISFSFKLPRFVGNLRYLMVAGKKPSIDLDLEPAKYPPSLNLAKELEAPLHPGDESKQKPEKEHKVRKRLTFDEVSNVIFEGIGDGPLRSARALEAAAWALKQRGKAELWNFVGALKTPADVGSLVAKAWRLRGKFVHAMWRSSPPYVMSSFNIDGLEIVSAWRGGKYKTHTLVLSGDGDLGKTSLAEALIAEVSPGGYWFIDDPDDFREVDGMVLEGHGIVIDEICLSAMAPNSVKKLLDVERARRVSCRHFNGTLPRGCSRILCTNSSSDEFYPIMRNAHDRKGVMRRQMWQDVKRDTRVQVTYL